MHLLPRRSVLLGLGSGLALALPGCGSRTAGDPAGRARVVSLSPSTTETVFAIGGGPLLVGRSRFCDHPPEAAALPALGGYSDPNIEAIVALRPSLVTGARGPAGPRLEEQLQSHGIDTYFPETESFDQIEAMVRGLGQRLGLAAQAGAAAGRLEAARSEVAEAAKGLAAPRTVMLFDTGPIVAAGPGGFPDEMMRLARAENAVTGGGAYPTLGLERLLALDPEVILDGASTGVGEAAGVLARREAPGWKELRAFATGRVHTLSSIVLRPGPRIGDGLRELARAVHGGALRLP